MLQSETLLLYGTVYDLQVPQAPLGWYLKGFPKHYCDKSECFYLNKLSLHNPYPDDNHNRGVKTGWMGVVITYAGHSII